jgi:hypothetical protein
MPQDAVPRITIDITDELANELLSRRVDAVGVCLTALREAVDKEGGLVHTEKMTKQTESKMGRPRKGEHGEKRLYRNVGLSESLWTYLAEVAKASDCSVNDVVERLASDARNRKMTKL